MSPGLQVVTTIDYLLRIYQDSLRPGRMFIYFGDILVPRFLGFLEGYRRCMRDNGLADEGYERFLQGLRSREPGLAVEELLTRNLRDCKGDHEQAIRVFLEGVAEFGQGSKPEAVDGGERYVGTFEALLQIRQDMQGGRPGIHIGDFQAERLCTFVDGYHACLRANGFEDETYGRFFDWLRDVKKELPGEGWPAAYLREFHGDHEQAIRKYLDLVAEFASMERMAPGGSGWRA
jgi:hypothetical protein